MQFIPSTVNASSKTQFTTTLFHDGTSWKVLTFDANQNARQRANDNGVAEAGANSNPVLLLQRVVNGQVVGKVEPIFISTLYRDIEASDGTMIATSGAINTIVKTVWDDQVYTSDAQAIQEIIRRIYAIHPDGIITCTRKAVAIPGQDGKYYSTTTSYGKTRPCKPVNFD